MRHETKRMKRMSRNQHKVAGLNLVSLMDVFTILVFFLLVNSASSDVKEPPKEINLPQSAVDSKPRETTTVMITERGILVQGEALMNIDDAMKTATLDVVTQRLQTGRGSALGLQNRLDQHNEVTILSDKSIPFKMVRKVMASCTDAGFKKISLAVVQKAQDIAVK